MASGVCCFRRPIRPLGFDLIFQQLPACCEGRSVNECVCVRTAFFLITRCDNDDDRPYVRSSSHRRLLLRSSAQFSELLFDKSGHGRIGVADGDGDVPYNLSQWDRMLSMRGHRTLREGSEEASSSVQAPATHRRL